MIFILILWNTTLKFPYGGMLWLVSQPLPLSAQPSKWFPPNSLSGLLLLASWYHSLLLSQWQHFRPSPISQSFHLWYMNLLLVTCFQDGPLPMPSSRQWYTPQLNKPANLLETWSLAITWRFLLTQISLSKSLLLLLFASGLLSFRIGCLTILRTSAHPARNKVSYAHYLQLCSLNLSFLELLVLNTSSAQEPRKPHVQFT